MTAPFKRILVIDYESFYSTAEGYTLKVQNTEQYLRDSRFTVLGMSYMWYGESSVPIFLPPFQIQKFLDSVKWEETAVLAHNCAFDGAILAWHYGKLPAFYLDTLSMARAVHGLEVGGSLAKLADHYGLPAKGVTVVAMDGKKDLTASEEKEYADYCKHDTWLCAQIFQRLLVGFPKKELTLIESTVRMFTDPRLILDAPLLSEHLKEVKEKKEKLLEVCEADQKTLASNVKFAKLLEGLGVPLPLKVSPTTGKETYAFAKTDDGLLRLLEHEDERVQAVVAARLGVKSTLEETRTATLLDTAQRGKFPIPLKYYGARTGRWSGDVYNMQNLPRKSPIKNAIKAPPGYLIVGCDLSNIELRVGLYFAKQLDKMMLLAVGRDLYKDFAATIYRKAYEDVTAEERQMGKTAQLSLIYGTGALKLRNTVKLFTKMDIGEYEAQRAVNVYRGEYTKVVTAWKDGDSLLSCMVEQDERWITYGYNNLVTIRCKSREVMLPSGLSMRYPDMERRLRPNSDASPRLTHVVYRNGKASETIYGAKLFQGCVQAIARCIMAEGILKIRKRYFIPLTIHDAVYALVPEGEIEEGAAWIEEQMVAPIPWIEGIPLAAETKVGPTLGDLK